VNPLARTPSHGKAAWLKPKAASSDMWGVPTNEDYPWLRDDRRRERGPGRNVASRARRDAWLLMVVLVVYVFLTWVVELPDVWQ
jgi:hypothetical protein